MNAWSPGQSAMGPKALRGLRKRPALSEKDQAARELTPKIDRVSPLSPRLEIHPAPAPQIAALSFLIGRLRGEGWLGDPSYRYTKEVTGLWEGLGP